MDNKPEKRAEVEITPEMIEAGLECLWGFPVTEPTEGEMREAVKAVFIAMLAARAELSARS